jgi:hypothetical protein
MFVQDLTCRLLCVLLALPYNTACTAMVLHQCSPGSPLNALAAAAPADVHGDAAAGS